MAPTVHPSDQHPIVGRERRLVPRYSNLPQPLTALIGREDEIARITALLEDSNARLVTLTGPGGVGKTRLAIAVAERMRHDFHDGVNFVALQALADPDLVPSAIAQTLGVREAGSQPLAERLGESLRDRQALLVLDNLEHLLPAASLIGELLASCSDLSILVTSRTVLQLYGEHDYLVPPLAVPDAIPRLRLEQLSSIDAVRLFVERATARKADFRLTPENAPDVAAICARVDGLPLAIELLAAWIKVLSPEELLARLDPSTGSGPLALLTGGPRDVPGRQQTMRDTLQWSYELLSSGQQRLFRRLAVFVGGWTLEAAEAVCDPSLTSFGAAQHGSGQAPSTSNVIPSRDEGLGQALGVFDELAALIDHSLVHQVKQPDPIADFRARPESAEGTGSSVRFDMLETIRAFGLEQLATSGEEQAVRQRHADWSLAVASGETDDVSSWPTDEQQVNRLGQEHANLRTALDWFEHTGQREAELRLAGELAWLWYLHADLSVGRSRLERALRHGDDVEPAFRAQVMYGLAILAWSQADRVRAIPLIEEAAAIRRELSDTIGLAHALHMRGVMALDDGDDKWATTLFEDALALQQAAGDRSWVAHGMSHLAYAAYVQGDYERAKALCERALALLGELGDEGRRMAAVILSLATIVCELGDERQAAALFRGAIDRFRAFGDTFTLVAAAAGLARAATGLGHDERAMKLIGIVDAFCEQAQGILPIPERVARERAYEALRSRVDETTLQAAVAAGRSVSSEEAIVYAIETADLLASTTTPTMSVATSAMSGLTPREIEVLELIGRRRSNREIAAELFISTRTVERHIENIYRKLDIHSRADAIDVGCRHLE